ncbi:unnamed protein product [Spirodela intermedia]|uniref:Uncharacterized protein n=1 Tax=Spirodela intermedia TaxID=51605 RepID=A0A7I8IV92_SPIIN|nr:unnamed protein product [Spirodela intermedia]CAA6661906.1 unnamed protein product [Spirodela intermedia]
MEGIMTSTSTNNHAHLDAPANNGLRMGAGEWAQQNEADINQILLKMMENKPSECYRTTLESGGNKETCVEKRGDFYSQYKEKRDEKLRSETSRKRAEKELQFKMMQEALDQRKAEMRSNALGAPAMVDLSAHPQKSRRNSSSNQVISPKPVTHSSSPSAPSSRTMAVASTRSSSRAVSSSTPILRKPQPAPTSTSSGPETEKSMLRPSGSSGSQAQGKIVARSKENKKQSSLSGRRITRTKADSRSKVTKKSSVVPVEAKPFLKKGGLRSVTPTALPPQSDGSLRTSENLAQEEMKDPAMGMAEAVLQPSEEVSTQATTSNGENSETEDLGPAPDVGLSVIKLPVLFSEKNQPGEEETETGHQGSSEACGSSMAQAASSAIIPVAPPSPLSLHSEMIEWGNAEKPPALVYHKEPPKGLRRLFMFGQKRKGDVNALSRSTPCVFSKGLGDTEEGKSASKRAVDAQEEGLGQQKTAPIERRRPPAAESIQAERRKPVICCGLDKR